MYTLQLNKEELLYLKLLIGKTSTKKKLDLVKSANELLMDDNLDIIASFLLINEFSDFEKKIIEDVSNGNNQYDNELYNKIVNAFDKENDILEEYTIRRLLTNIENDMQEDADTGFRFDMTIKEYLELILSYKNE